MYTDKMTPIVNPTVGSALFTLILRIIVGVVLLLASKSIAFAQGGSITGSPWTGCPSSVNGSYTFAFSEAQAGGVLCSQPSWSLVPSSAGTLTVNSWQSASVNWTSNGSIRVDYCVYVASTGQTHSRYVEQPFTMANYPSGGAITSTGPTTICTGGNANFTIAGQSGTVAWQKCTSGCGSGDTNWTTASSSNSNLTTTTQFRAKVTNGCGTSYSNTITITVKNLPSTASAGPDQTSAATCGLTSVTLAGNTPLSGAGTWSIVSGTGGSFGNASSPTSSFSGVAGSTYVLRWTINNSPCISSSDDVTIKFNGAPIANAGADKTDSTTCGQTSVALTGNSPPHGTGSWSIISGSGGSIANPSSPTSQFSGVAGSTYTLRWTVTNSPCGSATDDVVVTFNRNPTASNAGPDQTGAATCGLTSVTLAANTPSVGTGQWSKVSGPGGSFGNAASSTSTFSGTSGSSYVLRWTISNGPCTASTDNVTVTFNIASVGGTISPASVQVYGIASGQLTLSGKTGNVEKWQKKVGSGSWSDVSNTTTTLSYSNISSSTSYRAVVKNGVCPAVNSSESQITVYAEPTLTIQGESVIAPGGSTTLVTNQGLYSYQWFKGGVAVTGATSYSLTVTNPGAYKVSVKATSSSPVHTTGEVMIGNAAQQASLDKNYIWATTFLDKGVTETNGVLDVDPYDLEEGDLSQTVQYFDGLGRASQTVSVGASPEGNDIIQPVAYDHFGREEFKYLPYARDSRTGQFADGAIAEQTNFYQVAANVAHDIAYSKTIFEPSPDNRVLKQGAPGTAWQPNTASYGTGNDHSVEFAYATNGPEEVLLFIYDATSETISAVANGNLRYYAENRLSAQKQLNEDKQEVIQYVDKLGRTILKKVQYDTQGGQRLYAETYYIYDDFGNLVAVVPPEGVKKYLQDFNNN